MIKRCMKKIVVILAFCLIGGMIFCIWQNNGLVISKTVYSNPKVPEAFNNFTIVQISDLHNKSFGENQERLLNKLKEVSPDIIVITGDLIDRRRYNLEPARLFVRGAVNIAPVYYVSGNHEAWSGKYKEIEEMLVAEGVYILNDTSIRLTRGDSSITLLGASDPDFLTSSYSQGTDSSHLEANLHVWSQGKDFKILLSHRPELFSLYTKSNMDLVFSGHAHGGQIRIPGIGGIIAPDQGLWPKYTNGSYVEGNTTMFVSRGLGNSIFPLRIFNRPEIVVVSLKNNI